MLRIHRLRGPLSDSAISCGFFFCRLPCRPPSAPLQPYFTCNTPFHPVSDAPGTSCLRGQAVVLTPIISWRGGGGGGRGWPESLETIPTFVHVVAMACRHIFFIYSFMHLQNAHRWAPKVFLESVKIQL